MGTVGAVAVDAEGNVACATSTGGMLNKMEGRVGDTPCVGQPSPAVCAIHERPHRPTKTNGEALCFCGRPLT